MDTEVRVMVETVLVTEVIGVPLDVTTLVTGQVVTVS